MVPGDLTDFRIREAAREVEQAELRASLAKLTAVRLATQADAEAVRFAVAQDRATKSGSAKVPADSRKARKSHDATENRALRKSAREMRTARSMGVPDRVALVVAYGTYRQAGGLGTPAQWEQAARAAAL